MPGFHDEMVTSVRRITYDFIRRVGRVFMEGDCCTDMNGAIQVFLRMDAAVRETVTVAGETPRSGLSQDQARRVGRGRSSTGSTRRQSSLGARR